MQQYPSIASMSNVRKIPFGKPCIAFYKYDGSNLRFEWSPKQGWHKYGTRTQLFDASDPIYGRSIPLFAEMGEEIVRRVLSVDKKTQRITVFTEFLGPNSFAGTHDPSDQMSLRLIDVFLYKKGFMDPWKFVEMFGNMKEAPQIIYQGPFTQEFVDNVRSRRYDVWEGVVAKGEDFVIKIKTNAYFAKLKEVYGREFGRYWE